MKIYVNQIPFQGVTLEEDIAASELDLDTEIIKFRGPIKVKAKVSRITNAITVNLSMDAVMHTNCSRCLADIETVFRKDIQLNYPITKQEPFIDLNSDIREEMVLDYPMKSLCKEVCKGLCPKCGKNLNEGGCTCGST